MSSSISPVFAGAGFVSVLIFGLWKFWEQINKKRGSQTFKPLQDQNTTSDHDAKEKDDFAAYEDIIPLTNFDWKSTEPIKQRPFKPKYHLTMGITNAPFSELIEMDKTYLERLEARKQIMRDHRQLVLQVSPEAVPAVNEMYTWLTSTYLPKRFPTMFALRETTLLNNVTSEHLPLTPPSDPETALSILGANVDEDFLILLPSPDGDGSVLKAFILCCPSGFNTFKKLSLKLRDIHGPVPGYASKLALSMDRFFARHPCGKLVRRSNWAIMTHAKLFVPEGSHLYEGDTATEDDEEAFEIPDCRLRTERQMLWRLPKTRALVFSFKTYLDTLEEVKAEGSGEDLAAAIEGLKAGSVPEMYFYKRGVIWGERVKEFLRAK